MRGENEKFKVVDKKPLTGMELVFLDIGAGSDSICKIQANLPLGLLPVKLVAVSGGDKVIIYAVNNAIGHIILEKIKEFADMVGVTVAEKPSGDMYPLIIGGERTEKSVYSVIIVHGIHVSRIYNEKAAVGAPYYIAHSAVDKTVVGLKLIKHGLTFTGHCNRLFCR